MLDNIRAPLRTRCNNDGACRQQAALERSAYCVRQVRTRAYETGDHRARIQAPQKSQKSAHKLCSESDTLHTPGHRLRRAPQAWPPREDLQARARRLRCSRTAACSRQRAWGFSLSLARRQEAAGLHGHQYSQALGSAAGMLVGDGHLRHSPHDGGVVARRLQHVDHAVVFRL